MPQLKQELCGLTVYSQMNNKTGRKGDEELLLSSRDNWTENSVVCPANSKRPNRPLDVTTLVSEPSPKEKISYSRKDSNSTNVRDGNLTQKGEGVQSLTGDTAGVSPSSSKEANEYPESSFTSCSEWVSFEENCDHANLQDLKSDIVTPNRDSSKGDDDVLVRTTNEDDWVKFDVGKGDETTVSRSFIQPGVSAADAGLTAVQDTREELLDLAESLHGNNDYINPFDNSELDRINPFTQLSPKPGNVNSTKAVYQSLSSPAFDDTHQIETPEHENAPVSDTVDAATPLSKSNESLLPVTDYPKKPTNTSWSVLLRYPDTKRKVRAREWRPVTLKLVGSVLQVFEEHDTSSPFREVPLQCFYALTPPKLQQYHGTKVHSVKVQYVKYRENQKRFLNKNVQYTARTTPILKIASYSHLVIREFVEVIKDAIRSLPVFRDRGISHNTEAVYIDVHDTCSALLDSTGSVLMLGILVRIYLKAFVSGDAECQLVLNDYHLKSQEEARLREEHMPQRVHRWITLENCDFHSTVNPASYNQNHYILFHPLDSCTFEVMQFRVRPSKPLPLLACCDFIVDGHGRIEIKAEVKLSSDPKLSKYERKNISLYFPIPESWVPLFMKEKFFRGEKSIKSTSTWKAVKMRNKINQPPCTMEVSTGSAKYEPEYKAVVWRISQLPLLNTTAPADAPHDFICCIQTMDTSNWNSSGLPEDFKPHCVMEYEIPYTVASDTNIVNFKVSDQKIAIQEVTYNSYYSYHIQVSTITLNGGVQDNS